MIRCLAMALAALAFAGCGSNNNAAQTAAAQAAAAAAAASQTGLSGATGCIPISNGGFSFTGTGVSINPDAYLLAGTLPATSLTPGTYGTVVMGATSAPSGIGAVQYQPATWLRYFLRSDQHDGEHRLRQLHCDSSGLNSKL